LQSRGLPVPYVAKLENPFHFVTLSSRALATLNSPSTVRKYVDPVQCVQIIPIMEALPAALVLCWSARTLQVKCPFCLSPHEHGVGELPRDMQRTANCRISRGRSYRILYPDEESDFAVPFGWELDIESMVYTVPTKAGFVILFR
jgi:hypothetical protein